MELNQEEKERIIAEENVRMTARKEYFKEHGEIWRKKHCGSGLSGCCCHHFGFWRIIIVVLLLIVIFHFFMFRNWGYGCWRASQYGRPAYHGYMNRSPVLKH
jgi:hypothetical protein